jgi:hypothetical protein
MMVNFLKSCDYENGYRKSLEDVVNWIERHSESLKHSKLNNRNGIIRLMKAMRSNCDVMMKYGEDTEIMLMPDGSLKITGKMEVS